MDGLHQILRAYALEPQQIDKLEGYGSLNYRLICQDAQYLLKHYRDPSEYKLISQEEQVLQYLNAKDFPFKIPCALQELKTLEDGSFARLLPFIEGDLLSEVKHSDELMKNFGESVGYLNKALLPIENDTIQARVQDWDMKCTLSNLDKLQCIEKASDRKIVAYYLDLFEHHVLPIQNGLRQSIIHSDLNDNNIIVANDKVKGIIDFGDIAYSPLVYEVAIALTYIMLANEDQPFEKAKQFLIGYHQVLPLTKEEVELLHLLIPSRLCVSVLNSAKKKAAGEDSEYILISEKPAWRLLHKWIAINPIKITNSFLEVLKLPVEKLDVEALKSERKVHSGKSLSTSYEEPIYMTGAAFQYMYDHLGNTYLDAYNNIPHVGHGHPNISKVLSRQIRKLNTNTRYLYPEFSQLAQQLKAKVHDSLQKLFMLNSGSAAADLAIRMARNYTGRHSIVILESGYHGNTQIGIEISDYKHNGKAGKGRAKHIISLPLPNAFNEENKTGKQYALEAIETLKAEIEKGNCPAALIVESVSGCGGQVPLAKDYLKNIQAFLKDQKILLIADEVQTGFGRLGKYFWGYEMHKVIPDMLIMGKSMGNGHPVAGLLTSADISDKFANGMEFFSSFGGNPISCAVASIVLDTLAEEDLPAQAAEVGDYLSLKLRGLKDKYDCVADVRGLGLFQGIEFAAENNGAHLAESVKEFLKKNFILTGIDGHLHNVIKIKPPMCFSKANVDKLVEKMDEFLELKEKK